MKVLVTGATGFVGAAVARALMRAGWEVRVLVRTGSDRSNLQQSRCAKSPQGDLADVAARSSERSQGAQALFHVAADYRLGARDPAPLYRTNVEGTRNILNAARRRGRPTNRLHEQRRDHRHSGGRLAGRRADAGALGEHDRPLQTLEVPGGRGGAGGGAAGMSVVIVNPSTPVGPGDVKPTPTGQLVLDAAAGRMPAYVDTGLNIVHVDDVAAGHLLAFERGRAGERYILGGEDMTLAGDPCADRAARRA